MTLTELRESVPMSIPELAREARVDDQTVRNAEKLTTERTEKRGGHGDTRGYLFSQNCPSEGEHEANKSGAP